jgi:carnitine monooxygenase subunit
VSRAQLVEMARTSMEFEASGQNQLMDGISRMPASNYYDPARWQREVDLIFKRLPLLLATGAELREPNSYKSIEVVGVPVLITRGSDGAVRAFVNMCSHRGSMLVDPGSGTARRFTCPYHAWTYDQDGDLVGIFKQSDFGDLDMSCHGLTALPVAERAGLIWVTLSTEPAIDIDTYLCGYDELLAFQNFGEMYHYGSVPLAGPNWKVAFDGYVDFYHLPILHKNTFGTAISPDAVFHRVGPHQRITGPRQGWSKLEGVDENDWKTEDLLGGVWSVFPHGSIAGFAVGEHRMFQVARLFPGASADESVSQLDFIGTGAPTPEHLELVNQQIKFLIDVVRDEDYATGLKIQRTVKTGAKKEFIFGRNEGGARHVHGWLDRILATPDDGLVELFRDSRP